MPCELFTQACTREGQGKGDGTTEEQLREAELDEAIGCEQGEGQDERDGAKSPRGWLVDANPRRNDSDDYAPEEIAREVEQALEPEAQAQ